MAFIYLNKQTKEALIFGSIPPLSKHSRIKTNKLYEHFSRLKNLEFENENVRIIKTEIKRGGK